MIPRRSAGGRAARRWPIALFLPAVMIAMVPAGASAAPPVPAGAGQHPATATPPRGQDGDPVSRSVAARSRMLECGHQWSAMKKAGTAAGTWKEFSRGCLAQR